VPLHLLRALLVSSGHEDTRTAESELGSAQDESCSPPELSLQRPHVVAQRLHPFVLDGRAHLVLRKGRAKARFEILFESFAVALRWALLQLPLIRTATPA
jgi:hypothetical protein